MGSDRRKEGKLGLIFVLLNTGTQHYGYSNIDRREKVGEVRGKGDILPRGAERRDTFPALAACWLDVISLAISQYFID
jgi:hypothetical protein